jgi:hypothetical protein
MGLEFKRHRIDKRTRADAVVLLLLAAEHFKFREFGKRDLNEAKLGISSGGVVRACGSWSAGIEALRAALAEKGLTLVPRSRVFVSDEELFAEMHRIWTDLGHRPSRHEWDSSDPRFSYNTYKRRFGGWAQACLTFLERRMGEAVSVRPFEDPSLVVVDEQSTRRAVQVARRRDPSAGLRLKVLQRDGFRCVLCGRSPAIERGVVLHLDHVTPFADGGETTFDNLRTLCQTCNLGRGRTAELGGVGL